MGNEIENQVCKETHEKMNTYDLCFSFYECVYDSVTKFLFCFLNCVKVHPENNAFTTQNAYNIKSYFDVLK